MFPGVFQFKRDMKPYASQSKLRGDDLLIMKTLIKKYGEDVDKMSRDIKLNYLQWSKSKLNINLKALKAHH